MKYIILSGILCTHAHARTSVCTRARTNSCVRTRANLYLSTCMRVCVVSFLNTHVPILISVSLSFPVELDDEELFMALKATHSLVQSINFEVRFFFFVCPERELQDTLFMLQSPSQRALKGACALASLQTCALLSCLFGVPSLVHIVRVL